MLMRCFWCLQLFDLVSDENYSYTPWFLNVHVLKILALLSKGVFQGYVMIIEEYLNEDDQELKIIIFEVVAIIVLGIIKWLFVDIQIQIVYYHCNKAIILLVIFIICIPIWFNWNIDSYRVIWK